MASENLIPARLNRQDLIGSFAERRVRAMLNGNSNRFKAVLSENGSASAYSRAEDPSYSDPHNLAAFASEG